MTRPQLRPRPPGPRVRTEALPDWQSLGACVGADPDLFNGPGLDVAAALEICALCTVRPQCGDFGRRERADGVYGGRLLNEPKKPGPKPRVAAVSMHVERYGDPASLELEREVVHLAWREGWLHLGQLRDALDEPGAPGWKSRAPQREKAAS